MVTHLYLVGYVLCIETYALHFSIGEGFKPLIQNLTLLLLLFKTLSFEYSNSSFFSTKFPKHMLLHHLISYGCVFVMKMPVLSDKTETVLLFQINLQQIAGWCYSGTHTHTCNHMIILMNIRFKHNL